MSLTAVLVIVGVAIAVLVIVTVIVAAVQSGNGSTPSSATAPQSSQQPAKPCKNCINGSSPAPAPIARPPPIKITVTSRGSTYRLLLDGKQTMKLSANKSYTFDVADGSNTAAAYSWRHPDNHTVELVLSNPYTPGSTGFFTAVFKQPGSYEITCSHVGKCIPAVIEVV